MTSLSKTLSTAFGLILVGSAIAIPPPEGGFIDEDHKQRYTHHGNQLRAFEERYVEEIEPLKSTLRQALEVRLLELSTTTNPARIRELHKTTSEWFKEDGSLEISAEIPAELASEVTSYRTSVARRTEARDRSIAKEHHWLVRQLDHLALKFEEKGDLETMRALRKEARALMPTAGLKPTNYGQLELTAYNWHWQHFPFVRMQRVEGEQELISLSHITGNFAGGGEWVEIKVWDEGGLPGLHANSMQNNVRAGAYALRHPALKMDKARVRTESITFEKQRKKLIHHSRGFCYLGGIAGTMGDLTSGEVSLNPDDGFYYLSGRFENRSSAFRAIIVEYPEGEAPEFETSTVEWRRGDPAQESISAEEGICLLSGLSGAFRGEGEVVYLIVDHSGKWHLGGRSNLINTGGKAMVMRFK